MRSRLAAAIALVTLAALAGSFLALHERIGVDLQKRIDSNLKEQFGEFRQEALDNARSSADLDRASRRFLFSQRYRPESRWHSIRRKSTARESHFRNRRSRTLAQRLSGVRGHSGATGEE